MKETYEKLPKVFKRKWLKALSSGKFIKGKMSLKRRVGSNTYEYCCLGVAGEICGCTVLVENGVLLPPVKGLKKVPTQLQGSSISNPLVGKLTRLNDKYNTWERVIKFIEKNL